MEDKKQIKNFEEIYGVNLVKKKKILVYGFTYNIGGIETFYMNFYRKINKDAFQIDFIKTYDKIAFEDELVSKGSNMFRIPSLKKHPIRFYKEFNKILENGDYDVFHCNMLSCANIIHFKLAKNKVSNIIAHAHSNSCIGNLKKLAHYFNRRKLKKYVTCFLACSNDAAEFMFGKQSKKTMILHNAIDVDRFLFDESKRKRIRDKMSLSENQIVIGNVSRLEEIKNHSFLLDIFYEYHKCNNNSILILVGGGSKEAELKEKAKKLKIYDKVIFVGSKENVEDYYNVMDIFVLPSKSEGLGIVLIEAQANGLHCLTSKDVVPRATQVTNLLEYISLDKRAKEWAVAILNTELKRKDTRKDLEKAGYFIDDIVKELEKIYMN